MPNSNPLKVYITPHWHFDHAWIYSHDQYMDKLIIPNFRVLARILRKYPQFHCCIEQTTMWESLCEREPNLFEELKSFVQNGQISLIGGQYTSPDIFLPNGESLLRNYFYGKRYLQQIFNKDTVVAWNIDVFGQMVQYPTILRHIGMKYYVFHRGVNDDAVRKLMLQPNNSPHSPHSPHSPNPPDPPKFETRKVDSNSNIIHQNTIPLNAIPHNTVPHILFRWQSLNPSDEVLCYYQTNTYSNLMIDPIQMYNLQYFIDVLYHDTLLQRTVTKIVTRLFRRFFKANPQSRNNFIAKIFFQSAIKPYLRFQKDPRILFITFGADFTPPSGLIFHTWHNLQRLAKKHHFILKFKDPIHFFKEMEQIPFPLPIYKGNLLHPKRIFSGVWSSRIKIKQLNRYCERQLFELESSSTLLNFIQGSAGIESHYPFKELDELWHICLQNQFHDIIIGCCIDLVYIETLQSYEEFKIRAQKLWDSILGEFVRIIFQSNLATPDSFLIINPLPWDRTILFHDQLLSSIPALGYKVVQLPPQSKESKSLDPNANLNLNHPNSTFEKQFGQFLFKFNQNRLEKITDLSNNQVLLCQNGPNWVASIRMIGEKGDSYDTKPGPVLEIMKPNKIWIQEDNTVRTIFCIDGEFDYGNSGAKIHEKITIIHPLHEISFNLSLTNSIKHVRFEICFPHDKSLKESLVSLPFGSLQSPKGVIAAQNWITFQNSEYGLAIINSGTPEHIYHSPNCYITLLRSFDYIKQIKRLHIEIPLALELGEYEYSFTLHPYSIAENNRSIENIAAEILHPCRIMPLDRFPFSDEIPYHLASKTFSLFQFPPEKVSVSAIKLKHPPAREKFPVPISGLESNIVVRVYNPFAQQQNRINIISPQTIKSITPITGMEELILADSETLQTDTQQKHRTQDENPQKMNTQDENPPTISLNPFDLESYILQFKSNNSDTK